jgi:hypothetical protein
MTEPTNKPQPLASPIVVTSERLEAIADKHGNRITAGLFVVAGALLTLVVYYIVQSERGNPLPRFFWLLAALGVIWMANAVLWVTTNFGHLTPGEKLRLTLVVLGGLMGITIAIFGIVLPFTTYSDVFSGGFKEWRKSPGALVWTGLPLFGGLILAFVSLLLTSGLERSSAAARRLLYGYNAILSGVLLLFIFLLLNVLPYSGIWPFKALAQTADWTSSRIYSLSDATKERLSALDKPVKVYVILSAGDPINNEVQTLLQNCREITNRLSWETLSPEINLNAVRDLKKKYPVVEYGLLVVYGTDPDTIAEFIKENDLSSVTGTGETSRFVFKGEAALAKALTSVSEGKIKPVIYFTQGHGEFKLDERGSDRSDEGLGEATQRLSQANFEVKPLNFELKKPKVPDDGDIVVIARPLTEFTAEEAAALRSFEAGEGKKKGKLLILLDVVPTREGKMAPTGLESLLAEYGVQVGNERLISAEALFRGISRLSPLSVLVIAKQHSTNRIAQKFSPPNERPVAFIFRDVRTVSPLPQNPAAPPKYTVEELLQTPSPNSWPVIAEADLNTDPEDVLSRLSKDQEAAIIKRVLQPSPCIAVAVTESKDALSQIPGHEGMRGGESQPRMLVFGDASWAGNREINERGENYDLFVSCLNWLHERPEIGTQAVADKVRAEYHLPVDVGGMRLLLMPVLLILLSVVCVGTGVWVVRRR